MGGGVLRDEAEQDAGWGVEDEPGEGDGARVVFVGELAWWGGVSVNRNGRESAGGWYTDEGSSKGGDENREEYESLGSCVPLECFQSVYG